MDNILRIKDLGLQIGDQTILKDISCNIPVGQISVIVGPSGAGKSSLLKAIVRLYQPTGEIWYHDTDSSEIEIQEFRRNAVYVPQIPVVFPGTVEDNINWGRKIWEMEEIDTRNLLDLVGLEDVNLNKNAKDLSVGQQQRLQLARSLAIEPEVLLLDEPASGLDAISKEAFENLIQELQTAKLQLSIVMITHDLDQAKRIGEYGILMDKGKVKLEAESEQFFKEMENMSQADMLEKLLQEDEA